MPKLKECPRCKGFGEIMKRNMTLDSNGSADIGGTPQVAICKRCKGTGVIKERTRITITLTEKEEEMLKELRESFEVQPTTSALFRTCLVKYYQERIENKKEVK